MLHQAADRVHPGQTQCRSLAITARRTAGVMTRVLRPRSMISESGPNTILVREQSQAV